MCSPLQFVLVFSAFSVVSSRLQASDLIKVLREANQVVNPRLEEMARDNRFGGKSTSHFS